MGGGEHGGYGEHSEHGGDRDGAPPGPLGDEAVFWRNRTMALFDHLPLPLAFCDASGTIRTANPAMAAEWGVLPGALKGRNALDLFRPSAVIRLHPIAEAVRLRRSSRYPIEVTWTGADGAVRRGELTVDLISDAPQEPPNLLLFLRVLAAGGSGDTTGTGTVTGTGAAAGKSAGRAAGAVASPVEARVLALAAGGSTTAQIARAVGLTVDGVNYHLGRLTRRWGVANRTALVARAYVNGVLAPGTWPPEPAGGA